MYLSLLTSSPSPGFGQRDHAILDHSFSPFSVCVPVASSSSLRPLRILSSAVGATRAHHSLHRLISSCLARAVHAEPSRIPHAHALASGRATNNRQSATPTYSIAHSRIPGTTPWFYYFTSSFLPLSELTRGPPACDIIRSGSGHAALKVHPS